MSNTLFLTVLIVISVIRKDNHVLINLLENMSNTLFPTVMIVISIIRNVLINLKVIKYHYRRRSTAWST